ncbi:receptor-type tyrosine-protein phosphatase F-like [Acanthaster planci]|uniref:Receptor-type tyrosine-protein phosphatase F-like n=1 Tax=Acanthaster planci TaxID=133434 RepID=A0A8B7YV36_ACAPL|nr:receptor-type tyrosine-protein phosphatase F-like [Acanthaster planci]
MLSYRDCWYHLGITLLIAFFIPDQGLAVINLQDKHVSQSSNYNDAYPSKAVDGDIYSISHTQCSGYQWWRVDLVTTYCVERITIVNRLDGYGDRLAGAVVRAGVNSVHSQNQQIGSAVSSSQASPDGQTIHFVANPSVRARYVSVELSNNCLQLAELRIEEEAPDPVSSLQISQPVGTSHNQLVVTWTEPANHCPVDAYIIRYTLTRIKACSTNISNPVTVSQTVASSVTSETLDNLKPYSEYSVSVVAGNSAGYSIALEAYGETSAIEPSFLPTVTVLETTSTTLRYSWNEIPCDEVNGPSSSYQYRVSVTDISIRGSQSHPTHYRATRTAGWLKPCRPYSIKMAAINDIGLGPYGSAQEVTTPSGVVLGLSANAVNGYPTMLQVSWNRPSANCIITDYTLSYSLTRMVNCETEVSNRIVAGTTADTEYSITGLSPYSNYTIYVAARTSAGEGDELFVHGITAEAVPTEPPSDVINTSRQKQGLRFEWQPPPCLGRRGVITGYGYRLLDLERGGADITENTPSYERQAEISGLVPCTLYSFQVLARTAAGDGPYSEAIRLRTGLGSE